MSMEIVMTMKNRQVCWQAYQRTMSERDTYNLSFSAPSFNKVVEKKKQQKSPKSKLG